MRDIFTDDGRLINVKGMLELENYHFVITKEIVDSGKDRLGLIGDKIGDKGCWRSLRVLCQSVTTLQITC